MCEDPLKRLLRENGQVIFQLISELERVLTTVITEALEYGATEHKEALKDALENGLRIMSEDASEVKASNE